MRAGLSTIQQTLTPEAAAVLNQSISEASRRNHGQTTPLHVAATLLSSPSGYLRQVCIRSHPNSSHPLQCRALELCFSVALERLPTAQSTAAPPPISNALMAALKRAQAHQRRGCPEQQQQPLLAVKVELDQLIISILDDPSVSRVMREASFSSPAVKATIEQSLNNTTSTSHASPNFHGFGPKMLSRPGQITRPLGPALLANNRNLYLNPRLHNRGDEVNRVIEIMSRRTKKRNPVLVGDTEPEAVVKELLRKIENREFGSDGIFKNAQVISMERLGLLSSNEIISKIDELGAVVEGMIGSGGVILDLGDLKWLVEQRQPLDSEMGRAAAVVEMAKLLARFTGDGGGGGGGENKLWCIGTATCETYLRCQVYHSTMENDWDLQAVPMASRSPLPGMFPRLGNERFSSNNLVEPLNPLTAFPTPLPALTSRVSENRDHVQRTVFCNQCSQNYENDLAKLTATDKSFSEAQQEPSLPLWLQNAKVADQSQVKKDQGLLSKHKAQELEKKWRDTCLHLHQNIRIEYPNLLKNPIFHHKLQTDKPLGESPQLKTNKITNTPPGSPVRTDLVLGRNETDDVAKDFLDVDTYKKLLKGLMEKAWWQSEAASAVASAITRFRLGNGKQRRESRADIWLLFAGPDRVGKKKMASVLAEQICGAHPITICLGDRRDEEEFDMGFRGKTGIDRITEAVRRNPFSVIVLEDVDEADVVVLGNIKRAIERGRLEDSHGREVNLGNAIFILAGDWSGNVPEASRESASGNWQLGVVVREKSAKRRKEMDYGLSLDLNLSVDDGSHGSHESSDVTIDRDDIIGGPITCLPRDLVNSVDESIVFKPVDPAFVRREIKKAVTLKFSMMVDADVAIEVDDDVIEKILGGLWHDRVGLGEWVERSFGPSFDQLKQRLPVRSSDQNSSVVRIVVESDSDKSKGNGDWLPNSILV
ncbi:hypothetical protein ABFS82_11G027400 [Erythranthe guttata]